MVVTLAYIALFLVFSWVISRINQKSDSLSKSVFIAIFLGAVIGLSLHFISANHTKTIIEWYSIVGNGYVHLLKLVAIPLIFISILSAINKLENSAGIGKMSLTIVGCMLCLVMAAGFIGLLTAHVLGLILSGNNPARYFRMVWPVLTFAFVSRSSAASIPLAISAQEKFGVQSTIANISASFGSSMGQNGCAGIYPAIMVAMIAPTIGIDPLSLHFLAAMLPAIALGSIGVAGVGGGGTFAALIVLSTLNFPVALVGIFIAIEPIVDMARTALNVNGSMMSGVLANRILNNHTADDMPAVIDRP
ncbi:cation:dicarboxylase symporter family transporter [Salmonella enterica]|nr:cation:dicarboxylase symporter family transporter [Salmonella enterica]EKO3003483.1 cation:dicarboxylase symporter family transporter [Salmonella enterica subsp. enterica serovar Oranienburg]EJI4033285.1 cation:dicarboxylase symporter family transporter [Salmonella enterica]ELH3572682.1 cation:dicarboxylase symporter family transporter [Salmonella enterica]ELH3576220.1 cation:dicarboxylase symporter family transporter [Salmonella enterica]